MIVELYENAEWWGPARLGMLYNTNLPLWDNREKHLIDLIVSNGLPKVLWVASHHVWKLVQKIRVYEV